MQSNIAKIDQKPKVDKNANLFFNNNMQPTHKEYVKFTDVKSLVEEITQPILNDMKKREDEAIKATTLINFLNLELKRVKVDARQGVLLKGNMVSVNQKVNKIDVQYELANSQLSNMADIIDHKVVSIATDQENIKNEQMHFFEITNKRNESFIELKDSFRTYK